MKYILLIIGFLYLPFFVTCQEGSFVISIDKDTIYQNDAVKVEFLLDNLTGKFIPPTFSSFSIVSGPNTSSSYSIFNGQVSQKQSFSYIIIPNKSGSLTIGKASVEIKNDIITSEPISIFILEEGMREVPTSPTKRVFRYQQGGALDVDTIKTKTKRELKKF